MEEHNYGKMLNWFILPIKKNWMCLYILQYDNVHAPITSRLKILKSNSYHGYSTPSGEKKNLWPSKYKISVLFKTMTKCAQSYPMQDICSDILYKEYNSHPSFYVICSNKTRNKSHGTILRYRSLKFQRQKYCQKVKFEVLVFL